MYVAPSFYCILGRMIMPIQKVVVGEAFGKKMVEDLQRELLDQLHEKPYVRLT